MVAKSGASIEKFLKGRWCEVNYKQMIKNREKRKLRYSRNRQKPTKARTERDENSTDNMWDL